MALAEEHERVAHQDAQPADKNENIPPESEREKADEVIGHQEKPGIPLEEELVKLCEKLIEI